MKHKYKDKKAKLKEEKLHRKKFIWGSGKIGESDDKSIE